jgi:hypothetical protein
LFWATVVSLLNMVELQLRRRLGAEGDVDEPRLAVELQKVAVAVDVGDAGVDAPFHPFVQAAVDQLLAEFDELLLVDGGFLVGKDEEADLWLVTRSSISSATFFGSRTR